MTVRTAAGDFQSLKQAYTSNDLRRCEELLDKLKAQLVHFPTFLDPTASSSTKTQEIALAREVLEHGVLVATKMKDVDLFDQYFAQLRTFYLDLDSCEGVERSERRLMILGLNLLRLLVVQRLAEFHSELDAIPLADHANMFVKTPIMLERYLMEGSYNRLLHARSQVPSNEFVPLVDLLTDTVRNSIARCMPDTYVKLSTEDAQKMLMLPSAQEMKAFGDTRSWQLDPTGKSYHFPQADDTQARKELNYKDLLTENLGFAAQLQQVV
jgi:26S proteasome regulatory subunit N12